jgi:hypothetical protein
MEIIPFLKLYVTFRRKDLFDQEMFSNVLFASNDKDPDFPVDAYEIFCV